MADPAERPAAPRPAAEPPAAEVPAAELLAGHDPTERIVGLHADGPAGVRLYRRLPGGAVEAETVPVHPFFFLTDAGLLRGFPAGRARVTPLRGPGAYRHVVVAPDRGAYFDALRHVEAAADTQVAHAGGAVYTVGGPENQLLVQSGRTHFKGIAFGELRRLQLDLEVVAPEGFPQADDPAHRIVLVALSDSTGWERVVGGPGQDEASVLREAVAEIVARDPDVIEGHNLYGFDLPYLAARCRRHGVPLALGRDGSEPRSFPSAIRFAERSVEYDAVEVAGRHVVDTMFLSMAFDVFARSLPNYTLKGVAKHFGFASATREYVDGADIARVWREDPERLLRYALDDVRETRAIAAHLSGSHVALARMVPMPYGQLARTGPAAKIEALFVRAYLRARHALPAPEAGSQTVGGYTDVFVTGAVGPVVYADVESLYPSIMLAEGIAPASDALGLFPRLLRTLTDLRLETKAAMRDAPPEARAELDAQQTAYKNVINSFYGFMGFGFALFNDFAAADRVAASGQRILRTMVERVREAGGRVVEVDTDGVLFVPPPGVAGEDAERAFVAGLSDALPDGIRVGFDGRFARMLSFKKKTYALLGYDGAIRFKGSSLVSRSSERFGRAFVREAIRRILADDVAGLHALYLETRAAVVGHAWPEGVESFQRVETLKAGLDAYEADIAAGARTRAAAYEVARAEAARTGRAPRRGDRVAFYVAQAPPGRPAFEAARAAEHWDPAAPDEQTAFYLDRLDGFARRFEAFFETPHQHRLVFSPEDLFGFDAGLVRLVVTERDPASLEDDVPF